MCGVPNVAEILLSNLRNGFVVTSNVRRPDLNCSDEAVIRQYVFNEETHWQKHTGIIRKYKKNLFGVPKSLYCA